MIDTNFNKDFLRESKQTAIENGVLVNPTKLRTMPINARVKIEDFAVVISAILKYDPDTIPTKSSVVHNALHFLAEYLINNRIVEPFQEVGRALSYLDSLGIKLNQRSLPSGNKAGSKSLFNRLAIEDKQKEALVNQLDQEDKKNIFEFISYIERISIEAYNLLSKLSDNSFNYLLASWTNKAKLPKGVDNKWWLKQIKTFYEMEIDKTSLSNQGNAIRAYEVYKNRKELDK